MYRKRVQFRLRFATMSPSTISSFLRILAGKGKLARKDSDENYLIQALADYQDFGSQVICLLDRLSPARCPLHGV